MGTYEFKWGNDKGNRVIKELWFIWCTSLQQKLCCWIPCRRSHWTMIILQKMKEDKNKKEIKQISRSLEGHDYYWLTMFCTINVQKIWQFKLYIREGKTLTGIKIFISLLLLYSLWSSKLARKKWNCLLMMFLKDSVKLLKYHLFFFFLKVIWAFKTSSLP